MTQDVFRRLQEQLDQYSLGFPATDTGIELDILKEWFTEDEAVLFTSLTAELESPEAIARRMNRPVEETAARLEDMAGRGLLFRRRQGDLVEYSAAPFIHGLLEFQVYRLKKSTIKMVGRYIGDKFRHIMTDRVSSFIRTVPVGRSVDVQHHVAAYDDAQAILRDQELIVVTECACRKQKEYFDANCAKPLEVCFMFGPMGQYYMENGMGRQVDLDEALKILAMAQDAGLVTQPASAEKPFTLCSCCGDCCGFLRALNRHPRPASLVLSNYQAQVAPDQCSGCEICLGRCQMQAVHMDGGGVAVIDPDRCIGCGLCVTTCPEEAIKLLPKPDQARKRPSANTGEQMTRMARDRGLDSDDPKIIVSFGFQDG
ncbi:MAG: 4Fe-4S binding protein [Proteobacteria bacterium]|nr:4Fe-4S binding protein [Pseudomonadota bacterium]